MRAAALAITGDNRAGWWIRAATITPDHPLPEHHNGIRIETISQTGDATTATTHQTR